MFSSMYMTSDEAQERLLPSINDDRGPGMLPLCLCIKMPQKQSQICYFFAPKYAIVDKDITFPRRELM